MVPDFRVILRDLAINAYGFYLKYKRFTKDTYAEIERLQEIEYASRDEIIQAQSDDFLRMVRHAYKNVPYYRYLFDEYGIQLSQIQGLDDLGIIPILTKDDIRRNFNDLLARNVHKRDYTIHYTSGTTGEKLRFAISNYHHWILKTAHLYRFYAWAGIRPGDRRVTIGGRVITKRPPYWVYNRWENQLLLSIHNLNRQTVDEFVEKIRIFKPVFIQGHPSGITYIAERMLETKQQAVVKAIMTTGETLTDDQRILIEEAFRCRVFDFYGQGEGLFFAFNCENGSGYHESSEFGIIELQPTDSEHSLCSVIGTSLHNYAMPMLRYETGDLAEPANQSQCSCGRNLPIKLKRIIGRIDDRIYLSAKSYDYILPVTIRMHIKPLLRIGQNYQLYQLDLNQFTFSLVSSEPISKAQYTTIIATLQKLLGPHAVINFQQCEKLYTTGGKIRNIISDVKPSHLLPL